MQAGNTRAVQYNAQVDLQRRTPATRLSLDYIGNVSSINDIESADNHRVNTEFDLWLSRRFYLVLPSAEYYKDPFRTSPIGSPPGAASATTSSTAKLEWNITTGPAYQYAWFDLPSRENRRRKASPRSRSAAASNGTSLLASSGSCNTAANTPA